MADYNFIKIDLADGVKRITFNRPKHNVFDIAMMRELNAELSASMRDADLKCIVFLGEGKSWCAGVEVGDHKPEMVDDMIREFNGIFERTEKLDIPLVAGVHGNCLGGGMEVAIACDIIVASEKAIFGQPEIKLGFFPPYAAIRLPELIGPAKAIEVCTTGRIYPAAEAKAMGFVSHVLADDDYEKVLEKIVGDIVKCSPLILRLNKRAVKQHLGIGFEQAIRGVGDMFLNELMKTEDTLEGIASFEEKRKAVWKNK
jgi:cyclohexa-1,5-dienecarbonyl-CoA hydratase